MIFILKMHFETHLRRNSRHNGDVCAYIGNLLAQREPQIQDQAK
jgi:hypothetical protein